MTNRVSVPALVTRAQYITRDVMLWVSNPVYRVTYLVTRQLQSAYENANIPLPGSRTQEEEKSTGTPPSNQPSPQAPIAYSTSPVAVPVIAPQVSYLTSGHVLRGRRERYSIQKHLESVEQYHLYQASSTNSSKQVLVREYQLNHWAESELKLLETRLDELVSIDFRGGDFRIVTPWDAIVDLSEKRGYWLLNPDQSLEHSTLYAVLQQGRRFTSAQVRYILSQVLTSLNFLHSQVHIDFIHNASQEIAPRGIAYGNLNLQTLSLIETEQSWNPDLPFYRVYLEELFLWKLLFTQSRLPELAAETAKIRDLRQLGEVALHLLFGEVTPLNLPPDKLEKDQRWLQITDSSLRHVVLNLLKPNGFTSAQVALMALSNAAPVAELEQETTFLEEEPVAKFERPFNWKLSLLVAGLLGFGVAGWMTTSWIRNRATVVGSPVPTPQQMLECKENCKLVEVELPNHKSKYAIASSDPIWKEILLAQRVAVGQSFDRILRSRASKQIQNYQFLNSKEISTTSDLVKQVQAGQLDFALTNQVEIAALSDPLKSAIEAQTVAYDGVAIFVAFGDPTRLNSVPKQLNGALSFERLRQIYQAQDASIQAYAPTDAIATQLFEKVVMDGQSLQTPPQPLSQVFEKVFADFQNRQVSVGFGRLSQVFGQCSVYPLAIGASGQEIQPIQQDDRTPLSPNTDLCNSKGSFWSNPEVFKQEKYPMQIGLQVIYAKCNDGTCSTKQQKSREAAQKFVQLLSSLEGQCLLSEAGLVPIQAVRQTPGLCAGIAQQEQ